MFRMLFVSMTVHYNVKMLIPGSSKGTSTSPFYRTPGVHQTHSNWPLQLIPIPAIPPITGKRLMTNRCLLRPCFITLESLNGKMTNVRWNPESETSHFLYVAWMLNSDGGKNMHSVVWKVYIFTHTTHTQAFNNRFCKLTICYVRSKLTSVLTDAPQPNNFIRPK